MNHVDCVIKRDIYPQKCIHVLNTSVVYQFLLENIRGISKKIYHGRYCMGIRVVEIYKRAMMALYRSTG